jgi:hypothetical protein
MSYQVIAEYGIRLPDRAWLPMRRVQHVPTKEEAEQLEIRWLSQLHQRSDTTQVQVGVRRDKKSKHKRTR